MSTLIMAVQPVVPVIAMVLVVLAFTLLLVFLSRYRKCPSDKIMVIYGKVGNSKDGSSRSARCIHGGAAFIWPVFQSYEYMDLTPISISVDLKNALSRQNIRIDVPSRFTVGISTEPGVMQNAAERLLGLKLPEIQELAKDIIFGQLRLVVATMEIKKYVAGIGDTGGSTTLTFNLTSGTTTEIEAMISAYNTAKEANKEMWFEVWSPYLTKAFFFKGEPPQKIGMPEIGVNAVLQVEVPITVSEYHGLDTAVEPTV